MDPHDTTELMPPGFLVVAGHAARASENASRDAHVLRDRHDPERADHLSLIRWQETVGRRFQAIEVVSSIYGWYVRYASGLDGFAILAATRERGGRLDGSLAQAVAYARAWVAQAPDRYAFIRTSNLTHDDRALLEQGAPID